MELDAALGHTLTLLSSALARLAATPSLLLWLLLHRLGLLAGEDVALGVDEPLEDPLLAHLVDHGDGVSSLASAQVLQHRDGRRHHYCLVEDGRWGGLVGCA